MGAIAEKVEQVIKSNAKIVDLEAFREEIRSMYSPGVAEYIFRVGDKKLRVIAETEGLGARDCVILAQADKYSTGEEHNEIRAKYGKATIRREHLDNYCSAQLNWFEEERRVCAVHFDHPPTDKEIDAEARQDFFKNGNGFRFRYWAEKMHPEWFVKSEE
jgi:hypothetical protein